MGKDDSKTKLVKQLIKQIAGNVSEEDELIPEAAIDGSGEIWCYDPVTRLPRRIYRGIKVYILQESFDHNDRTLIYTVNGDMVCIDPEDLLYTGYD